MRVPGTVPESVRDALASFDAGRDALARGIDAQLLPGGLGNRSWRVRAPGVDWVVRVGGGRDAALAVDRRAELVALAAAARAGLAPAVVHGDAARGTCVLRFVPGRTWSRDEARSADGLARIGARVRDLHALPVPEGLPLLDVAAVLRHHLAQRPAVEGPVPRAVLEARVRAALAAYAPSALAFCHHDLHHLNVVDDGALTFVDWEYSAAGDPWLDLAAWASYHDLDAAACLALARACGYAGPAAVTTLERARAVFDCLEALWYDAADAWPRVSAEHRVALIGRLAAGDR